MFTRTGWAGKIWSSGGDPREDAPDSLLLPRTRASAPLADHDPVTAGLLEVEVARTMDVEPEEPDVPVVAVPSDLVERATNYATRLGAPLWDALFSYRFPPDENLKARKAELFAELLSLYERAGAFFADARSLKMSALAVEQESARAACRTAKDNIERLTREINSVSSSLRVAGQKTAKARVAVRAIEEGKPSPETYPSRKEIANWRERLAAARSALDTAQAQEQPWQDQHNQLFWERRREIELYEGKDGVPGLRQKELDLRLQLAGKARTDFETGLKIPADF